MLLRPAAVVAAVVPISRGIASNINRCCTQAERLRRVEDAILRLETELPHLATKEMVAAVGTEIANVRTELRTESSNICKLWGLT